MLEPSAPWVRLGGVKPKEWSEDMHATMIGAPVAQMQGLDKVAGRTRFAADVNVPGLLWGKMLRSPHPHARLRRMDAAAAWCVDVDYEMLPAVFDPRAAMRPAAPLLHDDGASYAGVPLDVLATDVYNGHRRLAWAKGDVVEDFRQAEVILEHSLPLWLAQTRARVHPQVHPAADGVPLRRDRDRLANDVQVAPALSQAALALERRAATVPVHQVHRLASIVGCVDGGQPAAGTLLEGGLLAGRDRAPELGDHRAAVDAPGVQRRVGPPNGVLHLGKFAEQTGPATRRLPAGQLDQRVDAGPRDAGDHGAVVGPDPGLSRQSVGDPRPALPLIVQRGASLDHRPPLRQEDILNRPVEAAGPAQPGHIPAPLDDLRFRTREDPAPVDRGAVRAAARLAAIENLEAP